MRESALNLYLQHGIRRAKNPIEIIPHNLYLKKNAEIKIPYGDLDENNDVVVIATYNQSGIGWDIPIVKDIDTVNNIITVETDHFCEVETLGSSPI